MFSKCKSIRQRATLKIRKIYSKCFIKNPRQSPVLLRTFGTKLMVIPSVANCARFYAIKHNITVIFRHSFLPVFERRRVLLHFFDPKQLLRVSCILWCYFTKWYSTILQNASLWCSKSYFKNIFMWSLFYKLNSMIVFHKCFKMK